jgi:4,5-dihydroxyphthalate decarboxylase
MIDFNLTLACVPSNRTGPIMDGWGGIGNTVLKCIGAEPEEIFRRALREKAFDIIGLSMSSHMVTTARGDNPVRGATN